MNTFLIACIDRFTDAQVSHLPVIGLSKNLNIT